MSAMIISSDEIRSTFFGTERKGYHKAEVDSFLDRVGRTISKFEENERILREQLRAAQAGGDTESAPSSPSPATTEPEDFAAVGAEVTAVLQAARESADAMRSAAEEQAEQIRREAEEFASECRRQAETDAEEVRGAAALTAGTLRSDAQADRTEAETLLREATETAASMRAEADQKATQVVDAAEQQAADLVATAAETAETEYRAALMSAQQRLAAAEGTEQEILSSLTAVHSDVGAAIARLDHETRSGAIEVPGAGSEADGTGEPAVEGAEKPTTDASKGPIEADTAPESATSAGSDRPEPETDLERTTRQITGGLAESLRETAGVSGPVGALFGLSDADAGSAESEDVTPAPVATPAEPETIDLRERPEAVQSLADSDDPLADLVKQAVGKAVERAAEESPEDE